jgi:hypothetical protein
MYFTMQVVEITKGSKVKYELDKKTGLIKVYAMFYPYDLWAVPCVLIICFYLMHVCLGICALTFFFLICHASVTWCYVVNLDLLFLLFCWLLC